MQAYYEKLNALRMRFLSLTYRQPWVYPLVLLMILLAIAFAFPRLFSANPVVGVNLPSELAIPKPRLTASCEALGRDLARNPAWMFRYAPTGTESGAGLPYWIYKVLPDLFPREFADLGFKGFEKFGFGRDNEETASGAEAANPDPAECGEYGKFYQSYPLARGLVFANTPLRLPFIQGEFQFTRVAMNCATCHRGGADIDGQVKYLDGMPSHSFSLGAYERFIADLGSKPAFNAGNVIEAINARLKDLGRPELTNLERMVYTVIVDAMRSNDKDWQVRNGRTAPGAGRIDAFNSFKFSVAKIPDDKSIGAVDYPGLWNQRRSVRTWHHYDGNTASSAARNRGSTVGVGALAFSVRTEITDAVGSWLENLPSPAWPYAAPDAARVKRGELVYKQQCGACHGLIENRRDGDHNVLVALRVRAQSGDADAWAPYDPDGPMPASRYMTRIPMMEINTDIQRYNVWRDNTEQEKQCLALGAAITPEQLQQLGSAQDQKTRQPACRQNPSDVANPFGYKNAFWELDSFRPATGYLAGPLDGVWAKAPYLHNGAVPNLRDLLKPAGERPRKFVRGRTAYNPRDMGFDSGPLTAAESRGLNPVTREGGGLSEYDTTLAGNRNTGHEYGVALPGADKDALLDYLKTL